MQQSRLPERVPRIEFPNKFSKTRNKIISFRRSVVSQSTKVVVVDGVVVVGFVIDIVVEGVVVFVGGGVGADIGVGVGVGVVVLGFGVEGAIE